MVEDFTAITLAKLRYLEKKTGMTLLDGLVGYFMPNGGERDKYEMFYRLAKDLVS